MGCLGGHSLPFEQARDVGCFKPFRYLKEYFYCGGDVSLWREARLKMDEEMRRGYSPVHNRYVEEGREVGSD